MAKFEQQADRGDSAVGEEEGGRNVALIADHEVSREVADEITERFGGNVQIALIAPAITRTRFEHAAGNADDARVEAEARIDDSLPALEQAGLEPEPAAVGDADPVTAIEDALREFEQLDEIVLRHQLRRRRALGRARRLRPRAPAHRRPRHLARGRRGRSARRRRSLGSRHGPA